MSRAEFAAETACLTSVTTPSVPAGAFFGIANGRIVRVTVYYNLADWIRTTVNHMLDAEPGIDLVLPDLDAQIRKHLEEPAHA